MQISLKTLAPWTFMFLVSCSAPPQQRIEHQNITVLPVLDLREDKTKADVDLEHLQAEAAKSLARKGYTPILARRFSRGEEPLPEQIGQMTTKELSRLGPRDSKALFLVTLKHAAQATGVSPLMPFWAARKTELELSATIVDQESGVELWREEYSSSGKDSGLFSGGDQLDWWIWFAFTDWNVLATLANNEGRP